MGKGSKPQIIGYKYFFGEHLILASNPLAVLKILFQDKLAWHGRARGGSQITVDKEGLFGGKAREGGVSGTIDVLDGAATQTPNDYLLSQIGAPLPAFRHMTSLVFRHFYHGNNYYPKPPKTLVLDSHIGASWNAHRAFFARGVDVEGAEIYIGIDCSASMDTNNRYINARAAVASLLRELKGSTNSVMIHLVSSGVGISNSQYNCTDADYEALAIWVEAQVRPDSQFYLQNCATACAAFVTPATSTAPPVVADATYAWNALTPAPTPAPTGRRIAIIVGDGDTGDGAAAKAAFDAIGRVEVFAVALDNTAVPSDFALVDNTPEDGVLMPTSDHVDGLLWALRSGIASWVDLNPAHILRDIFTATEDNGNDNTDSIGASFEAAAEVLFTEGFGLSFFWRNSSELNKFKTKLEEHVDCTVFFSRLTGKWEIKLIRNDYDVATLPRLDVLSWKSDVSREVATELPNKLTLTYRKMSDGEKKSITVTDPASIAVTGTVRPVKIDFEGIHESTLAAKVASRELRTRSQPKWAGTIIVGSVPQDFDLGSAFVLNNNAFGMRGDVVCRAVEVTYDVEQSRNVTIKFIEDKFSLGDVVDIEIIDLVPVTRDALNVVDYYLDETPYYMLVQQYTQATADEQLATSELTGRLFMGAKPPNAFHVGITYAFNTGAGWESGPISGFTPTQTITAALSGDPTETTITISGSAGLEDVQPNTVAKIGNEIIRVDSLDITLGVYTLTIGRGCLDTIPQAHAAGTDIMFFENHGLIGTVSYLSTETVNVRYLTNTASDELALGSADVHSLTFAHRAIRPYRVGDLLLNGVRTDLPILPAALTLTWKHRDRTIQTTATADDYLASDIGPEAGVTYRVKISCINDAGTELSVISEVNVGAVNSYIIPDDLEAGRHVDTTRYAIEVITERDSLDNWVNPVVYCSAFTGPGGLTLEEI